MGLEKSHSLYFALVVIVIFSFLFKKEKKITRINTKADVMDTTNPINEI